MQVHHNTKIRYLPHLTSGNEHVSTSDGHQQGFYIELPQKKFVQLLNLPVWHKAPACRKDALHGVSVVKSHIL